MNNEVKNTIEISEFLSILGNEFMQYSGYGVYAFLTHQTIYDFYDQYATAEIPVEIFARKLVKEHLGL